VAALVRGNGEAVLAIVRSDEPAALVHLEALAGVGELPAAWPLLWLHGLRALLATAAGSAEATESVPPVARRDPRVAAYLGYSRAIVDGRAGLFDRAADAFDSAERTMPPGWRREHARLVVARLAFAGDWGEPERWIREALTFLDAVPLARFSAASKSVLRSAGAPVPRRGRGESAVPLRLKEAGVTSREMDVLNLVAERLGNKEIGACLYLSPRTIEGHVASLIRKLDLDDRADLIAAGRRFAGDVPAERS
jgi:DNA-binding CsgD family transcriptional regulator